MGLVILHTNDLHGQLSEPKLARLIAERETADLYFDSGDAIKTGNLGVPLSDEPVWPRLAAARCTASVIGNRETHLLEPVFRAKLAGGRHPVLCANLRRQDGTRPLSGSVTLEAKGVRVAVFGLSVPMVTERMASRYASAYLWDDPVPVAAKTVEALRPRADLLVLLSHLGYAEDVRLVERVPGIDVLLGGHSHAVLPEPELHGSTWIAQGGSHARYFGRYTWNPCRGLSGSLQDWTL